MTDTPDRLSSDAAEIEVVAPGRYRRFTKSYKRRILAELDACEHFGDRAALLRREGLYSSYVTKWRRQMAHDDRDSSKSSDSGKPSNIGRPRLSSAERENRRLKAENERLRRELERANLAIDVQKKLCALLETFSTPLPSDPTSSKP